MRSFNEVVKSRKEEHEKSLQRIWRKQYIFDKELVNDIVQIKNNTSIENIITRFESIDKKYEMLSYEEALLEKQEKNFLIETQIQMLSMEAGISYLDYSGKGSYQYFNAKTAGDTVKGSLRMFVEYFANQIIAIINIVIKIINVAIQFVLNIVQFISTQLFKLLANKKIPRAEFEEKMSKLSSNSFKKNLKTRYQLNTGELIINGLRNFQIWGRMTEEKSKWLVGQYESMLQKSTYEFGEFDVTSFNTDKMVSYAEKIMEPYAVTLHEGLIGSLEKDFLDKSISSYRDSFNIKLIKLGFEKLHGNKSAGDSAVVKLRSFDNNTLHEIGNQIVKVIFGKKDKSESVDILEFFRNNAEILTEEKNEELKKFIDACKNSVQYYKTFSKEVKQIAYKYDTKNNNNDNILAQKINQVILYHFYQKLLLPYTRVSCSLINFVRRGFVLEYYKFKLFVVSLWNKANFSANGDDITDEETVVTDDDATPQDILRIGVIE